MSQNRSPLSEKMLNRKFLLKAGMYCVLAILVAAYLFYISVASGWIVDMPSNKELRDTQNYTASEIYSSDGVLLGKYYIQDRTNVAYESISPNMINALIATEDARFYKHKGIDNIGMLRVFFKSILLGDDRSGGGSTLSQQLAKNLYPRKKFKRFSMVINKLKEAILAQRLENNFSKKEILTLYLNTVPFGDNAFGIESASNRYFNTSAKDLRIEQAALLVGMLKATSTYNPRRHPENALRRRNIVLGQMAKYNFITAQDADSLKQQPVRIKYHFPTHSDGLAPYFRENLRLEVAQWCKEHKKPDGNPYNLYTDGLKIYTTIDSRMQKYAEEAVSEHMQKLQLAFYTHWKGRSPWGKNYKVLTDAKKRTKKYNLLVDQGATVQEINKAFATPVKMNVFTWKGPKERFMSPLDSIRYYLWFLRAGFLAVEPNTGYVRAWVGGIDHHFFKYDQVNIRAKRQVGSTFKPFVYAAALENGVNPCEYLPNERMVYTNYNNWSPRNSDDTYGGAYNMTGALTRSLNTISAQLIMRAGINKVVDLAKLSGISSNLDPVPSLALGTADISLSEMVEGYSSFANGGMHVPQTYLLKIVTRDHVTLLENPQPKRPNKTLSADNAGIMTSMLQQVVNEGTAARLRYQYGLNFPIAGKTGTTQSHADGWFIGFTPRLTAGVWVGGEDRRIHFRSIELGQGASMALPIWARFMSKIAKDKTLRRYTAGQFPVLSEKALSRIDCSSYINRDSLSFLQRLFGVRNKPKEVKQPRTVSSKERSEKYQQTLEKIKNLFRRKNR